MLNTWALTQFYKDKARWPLWAPVFLGLGIALYFALPQEPFPWFAYGGLIGAVAVFWKRQPFALRSVWLILTLIWLGFAAAFFRTHTLNTSMLQSSLPPLPLEGTVAQVELKPTLKGDLYQRIVLKIDHAPLPKKVRITLKGKRARLWPGDVIRVKAKLSPISDASLPGEFDFRRHAYFQAIGATGFALSAPEIIGNTSSWKLFLEKKREKITAFLLEQLPAPQGAIAAALITGDKASIPEDVREKFIDSGLAHILAISGLHLTIIAGVVFAIIRRGLSLLPSLSLFYNTKKIAAVGTILITFCYLVLSGFGIPAQRAFMMITLVMGAILIDRMALSLRSVALAAFIILMITPESLLSPSFQLSFAAVVGLITGYESWKNPLSHWVTRGGILRKLLLHGGGTALTSLLATLATLPVTIYSFHHFSLHAIEANLVAIPLVSLVVMPLAFLSCLFVPLGLGALPLKMLGKSIALLISIATTISSWPGVHIQVAQPSLLGFSLIILGGLWLCLWQQSWRWMGLVPILCGTMLSCFKDPPHILVDGRGKVAALYKPPTLYLSSKRRGKFTAESWAASLGTSKIELLPGDQDTCKGHINDVPVVISSGKDQQPCLPGAILIRLEASKRSCPQALFVLDWFDLWKGGSHALWVTPQGVTVKKVRASAHRPWTKQAIPRSQIWPSYGVDPHLFPSKGPYNKPATEAATYR